MPIKDCASCYACREDVAAVVLANTIARMGPPFYISSDSLENLCYKRLGPKFFRDYVDQSSKDLLKKELPIEVSSYLECLLKPLVLGNYKVISMLPEGFLPPHMTESPDDCDADLSSPDSPWTCFYDVYIYRKLQSLQIRLPIEQFKGDSHTTPH